MLTQEDREAIRSAFRAGRLEALSSEGWMPISDVLQHTTPHKRAFSIGTKSGRKVVATEDHSLFLYDSGTLKEVSTGNIARGSLLAVIVDGCLDADPVTAIEEVEPLTFSYDLSVPGPENFALSNGILAHNSYSIGGVSLDVDKSSKYESAANNFKDLFEGQLEKAKATVKIIKGLQQPRFGVGIRSAFGPYAGRGQLTPSKFVSA